MKIVTAMMVAMVIAGPFGCDRKKGTAAPAPMLRSNYDKFKDETTLETTPVTIVASGGKQVTATAMFTSKGDRGEEPAFVHSGIDLFFKAGNREAEEAILLIDGRREKRGVFTDDGSILISFNTKDFAALANAKSVEMQCGSVEFAFGDEYLSRLRMLETKILKRK